MLVGIVDYGSSNLFSISNAIKTLGYQSIISNDLKELEKSDILILPGVGSFKNAMDNLIKLDLVDFIKKFSLSQKIIIGICLGFQLMFEESTEFCKTDGLGIIKGKVLDLSTINTSNKKIPNTGWKKTFIISDKKKFKFFGNFYYVHSFFSLPTDQNYVWMNAAFGDKMFCAAVKKKNIYGFQFHPEKSGLSGITLLKKIIQNEI